MTNHIVIIVDVNSIPREGQDIIDQSLPPDADCDGGSGESQKENLSQSTTKSKVLPYYHRLVKGVKDMVVGLLCKEAMDHLSDRPDLNRVLWSFKIFNSSVEINSKPVKSFQAVSTESVEAFEKQLDGYLDNTSLSNKKSDINANKVQHLSSTMKSVLCDLQWPDVRGIEEFEHRNVIYALFRVPRTDVEIQNFTPNWSPVVGGSKSIMNELLPRAFYKRLKDFQIQVNFMDMCSAFSNYQAYWDYDPQPKPMMKIANFLGGTIVPFTYLGGDIPLGFPSYIDMLRIFISDKIKYETVQPGTTPRIVDETHKTIRRLQGSINGSMQISPEDDSESFLSSTNNNHHHPHHFKNPHPCMRPNRREVEYHHENLRMKSSLPYKRSNREEKLHDLYKNSRQMNERSSSRRFVNERETYNRRYIEQEPQRKRKYDYYDEDHDDEFDEDVSSDIGYSASEINNRLIIKEEISLKDRKMAIARRRDAQSVQPRNQRKYEFEEDMQSQVGYSTNEIKNWCVKGVIGSKKPPITLSKPQRRKEVQPRKQQKYQFYEEPEEDEEDEEIQSEEGYSPNEIKNWYSEGRIGAKDRRKILRRDVRSAEVYNNNAHSQSMLLRTASFLSVNNPKRQITIPASNKLQAKSKLNMKLSQSTISGSTKQVNKTTPKSKGVRRNLFDVPAGRDPKEMKMLMNLATTNGSSSFARSPSLFKSPSSRISSPRSPLRASPFFAKARAIVKGRNSRRQLVLGDTDDQTSSPTRPKWNSDQYDNNISSEDGVLCDESPNPGNKKGTPNSCQSSKGKSVIGESPEIHKPIRSKYLSRDIGGISFYSNSGTTDSFKSRAWERSGKKLMAARIKDSVDLHTSSLSLKDLEFLPNNSPTLFHSDVFNFENPEKNSNNIVKSNSPTPCSSKSGKQTHVEISPQTPLKGNMSSLITNELLVDKDRIAVNSKNSELETPSKKVSFIFGDMGPTVTTPSPSSRGLANTTTTPKSILKDAGNTPT